MFTFKPKRLRRKRKRTSANKGGSKSLKQCITPQRESIRNAQTAEIYLDSQHRLADHRQMIDHQTARQQRRTNATDELMRRVACRQKAFDSLDQLDATVAALSDAAAAGADPLSRAERVVELASNVVASIELLRRAAANVRDVEHTKPAEVAKMLDVPRTRLFPRTTSQTNLPDTDLGEQRNHK